MRRQKPSPSKRPQKKRRPSAAPPKSAPPPEPVAVVEVKSPHAKELRILRIHGKVQGVGYRFFATRVARRLGLKGSVQNMRDGTVVAIVEGERGNIDRWIEELKEGPRHAEVTSIDQETKEYTGRLGDFDVKF